MKQFELYFLIFAAASVAGWAAEVICKSIEYGRFMNRGFLIGPYCPIYGAGAVLVVLLLEDFTYSPPAVFFLSMLICGTLEYAAGWGMEKLFRARWWDYSGRRFNLNGRVCMNTLIPFGFMCLALLYFIKPFLFGIFGRIPELPRHVICAVLAVVFAADIIISARTLARIRASAEHTGGDDTEHLTRAVRDELMKKGLLIRRYMKAFPHARIYNSGILRKIREESRELQRRLRER